MLVKKNALAAATMVVALFGFSGVAVAETDGSVLAGSCANCHGTDGRSPGAIPSIAGLPYDYLLEQLLAFKAGDVPGATVMTRHAKGYTDEELDALARYFSEIEP